MIHLLILIRIHLRINGLIKRLIFFHIGVFWPLPGDRMKISSGHNYEILIQDLIGIDLLYAACKTQ